MRLGIATLVFIPLLSIALAHFVWALGRSWPYADARSLAHAVTGFRGATGMPPRLASLLVAIGCILAGFWAVLMADPVPSAVLTAGGALIALAFLARGVAGYLPAWRRLAPEEPFATLDRRWYSPLSLAIGLGFLLLTYWRL